LDRWIELITAVAGPPRPNKPRTLFLFPEFNLQGFPMGETAKEWIEKACITIPGPETARLQEVAAKLGCFIGLNAYETDPEWPGRYFNCSFLIDATGEIILKYRRINTVQCVSPHDIWDNYVAKVGIEGVFPVARTELGNISMMPCGEVLYPEAARAFMLRGAEVILHPTSENGANNYWAWNCCRRARASENMVYFVSANAGGLTGSSSATHVNQGHSRIVDFNGMEIASSGGAGENTSAFATIDIEKLREARRDPYSVNRLLRHRHSAYKELYAQADFFPSNAFLNSPMESKEKMVEALMVSQENLLGAGILHPAPDES
jgi:predicted amidohydrolase